MPDWSESAARAGAQYDLCAPRGFTCMRYSQSHAWLRSRQQEERKQQRAVCAMRLCLWFEVRRQTHYTTTTDSFIYLLHNAGLSLGKSGVPPQLVLDVLHFNLDTALGFLAVAGRRFLNLQRTIGVIVHVLHAASIQAHRLRGHASIVITNIRLDCHSPAATARTRHHRMPRWQLLQAGGRPAQGVWITVDLRRGFARQQVHAVAQVESGVPPARRFHAAPQFERLGEDHQL